MTKYRSFTAFYNKSPLYQLFVSLLIVLAVGILLFSMFLLTAKIIFDANLELLENHSLATNGKEIAFLRYILISQDLSFFIVPAVIILIKLNPGYKPGIVNIKIPKSNDVLLVVLLAFCLFPVTSFTGQINSGMELPDWLSGVEHWMKEKEDSANQLLDMFMIPDTFSVMMLNIFMIAIIPAIGEELIFRGVFQIIFQKLFKSGHISVWVTSFLFSAFHFQFFGFVPRFILGLVFGYLFLWSKSLWLPVISHFTNNAVPTVGAYLKGWEVINEPADIALWKQLSGLTVPVTIGIIILFYFRNRARNEISHDLHKTKLMDL
jgi:uncharacterized protein